MDKESVVFDTAGQVMTKADCGQGYYKQGTHFYNIHSNGIAHVNIDIINTLDAIYLSPGESLQEVSQEIFENEVRNAIFNIGIYKYVNNG